jgi:phosphoglycerate-specific signal transduction histidine kinase
MPPPSDDQDSWSILQKRIIGFGEQSARKSYYPELQKRLQELEEAHEQLHEKNSMLEEEIAERQRAEEALAAKQYELELVNASLEDRIAVAVAELRQKDELLLYQSRLAAMGELLQNIAHQWRQPLNNIAIYLQNIQFFKSRGELSDEEMNHDINSVLDILQYMSKTIDDFRNFFRGDCSAKQFTLRAVAERFKSLCGAKPPHKLVLS